MHNGLNAKTVARWFYKNMKSIDSYDLQRLLYYSQAMHLEVYGEPLYSDNIEAWKNGPVIREIYSFCYNSLDKLNDEYLAYENRLEKLIPETINTLLYIVLTYYKSKTDEEKKMFFKKLEPWKTIDSRNEEYYNEMITIDMIRSNHNGELKNVYDNFCIIHDI